MLRPYNSRGQGVQPRHIYPPPLAPRLERQFGELHPLRAFVEIVREWRARRDMQQEPLPLHFEGVVEWTVVSYGQPPCAVVDGVGYVGVPHGARRVGATLGLAITQGRAG